MRLEQQQVGTVDVLTPMGPLVDEDVESFRNALLEHLRSANPRVVVAMQEVAYMDSSAIEGLLDAVDVLADRAMTLKLVSVTPTCREVFELTGWADKFAFFNDVQDAVKSFL